MAPSNDSSASTSWGGTRVPLGKGGGAARRGRGRVSSKAWTTAHLLCRSASGERKAPIGVGKPGVRVDKRCTSGHALWTTKSANRHAPIMGTRVYQRVDAARARARGAPWSGSCRDLHRHDGGDVAEELDGHLEGSRLLDVLGQHNVLAVHLDPLGALARVRHVGRADGAEEPAATGRPGVDRDHCAGENGGLGLRRATVLRLALVAPAPHLLGLALHSLSGHDGAALGQEEVAGEAARHLDDVPPSADAGDVVSQHDLHASAPVSAGSTTTSTTAPASASAPACSTPATASASATTSAGASGAGRWRGASVGTESSVRSPRSRPPRPPGRSVTVRCV